jgi:thiamine-phosphate pyrophosphorylase
VEILDQARETIRVPTVVIGGMTPENAAPLVSRGANMVAAISSVYQAESVAPRSIGSRTCLEQENA